jgi:hypothetical protein
VRIAAEARQDQLMECIWNGRHVRLDEMTMCPLSRAECAKGKVHMLEVNAPRGFAIEQFFVHCVRAEELREEESDSDWVSESTSLFDFVESREQDTLKDKFMTRIVRAIGVEPLPEEVVAKLVRLLYTKPEVSEHCRLLLVTVGNRREELTEWWAKGIEEAIDEVHPELVKVFWRDFSLLPEEMRKRMEEKVWHKLGDSGIQFGIGPLLSALL